MPKAFVVIIVLILCSFTISKKLFIVPDKWPQPIYNFNLNPLAEAKVELGKMLFYDPALSANNTISCASCHSPYSAFTHVDHALSHGINDSVGSRNSPALMNLAWQKNFMWDGAINNLDMQALAPITHPKEMGSTISQVVDKLNSSLFYKKLFFNAFGDSTVTGERTLKAMSQFMLTLVSANSKYDSVMRNEASLTDQEKNGYTIFKLHCSTCHREPLFTTNELENNGLPLNKDLQDIGRMKITGDDSDSLKFKIPTLRNVEYSYPYMHDGRFKKLSEVINHYTNGIQYSKSLSQQLRRKIELSSNEKVDLVAFLLTLSDKAFVFNPAFNFPKELLNKDKTQ